MSKLKLSKQGKELIKLYEKMVKEGYSRRDGVEVKKAFSDFELRKFRNLCKEKISNSKIKYKILLTGGYANFFNKMIKKKVVIDQDITIKGIANAYKELV